MSDRSAWARLVALDRAISGRLAESARIPAVRWLAWLVAHSGDSQWWLLMGGALWWWGSGSQRDAGGRILLATLVAGVASGVLKLLVRRSRPAGQSGLYLAFDRLSFPSGHATRIGALLVVLGALMPAWGASLFGAWGLSVGVGRVMLGVHYAADIAAGLLVGLAVGLVLVACCL